MSWLHKKSVTAKLVGPNLVASFPTANPPLIWRFDLERNHSFTLALQGENSDWEFGVTSPKGEFYSIAHFQSREAAEEAFAKTQKALMSKRATLLWTITKYLIGLVLFAFVLFVSFVLIMKLKLPHTSMAMPSGLSLQQPQQGIPQSADDILKAPY